MSIVSEMLSLPFLRRAELNTFEKELVLKVCVYVAQADGDISSAEISTFQKNAAAYGGFHPAEVEKSFAQRKALDTELRTQLKQLDQPKAHALLKMVFLISNADGHIGDKELAAIKAVSEIIIPGKSWHSVHNWIVSYKSFIDSSRELFSKG